MTNSGNTDRRKDKEKGKKELRRHSEITRTKNFFLLHVI